MFKAHRHKNNTISIDRIFAELHLEDPSPIIAYKALVLRKTLMGKKLFVDCNDSIPGYIYSVLICAHFTHKINEYGRVSNSK